MSEESRYLTILNRKEGFLLDHKLAKRTKYGLKVQKTVFKVKKTSHRLTPDGNMLIKHKSCDLLIFTKSFLL